MQKFLRTLTLMAFMLVPWVTQAQTLTVADGTETNQYVPFYGYYADESQHNQVLYPAADLTAMVGKNITQMVFHVSSYSYNNDWGTWTVSLGETSATSLSGLDNATTLTQVFSGAFEATMTSTTLTITFDDPYTYNGGNLLLDINHPAGSWSQCYFYGIEATGASYCYDAQQNFLPKTTFSYETPSACAKPNALAVQLTPGNGTVATLSWNETGTATTWQICLNDDETNLINATTNPYQLTGLTAEQAYTAKVRANCGGSQSAWSNPIAFTPTAAYSITVNDGTSTNGYVPIYGYYCDDHIESQFVIPASDLVSMQYGHINKLTFYSSNASVSWGAAQFEVYVTETSATGVSAMEDLTSMTQVMTASSLSINGNQMEVTLTTPYQYMGGNLLIAFYQPTSGSYVSCSWYGVSATGASMGGYGSSISQQDFLPKTKISYIPGEAPSCIPVNGIVASDITSTGVTLSWADPNSGSNTYTIKNVTTDEVLTSTWTSTTYNVTGLSANTNYTFSVVVNCASSTSNEATVAVKTACGSLSLPQTFTFESDATNQMPDCWLRHPSNTGVYVYSSTSQAHNSSRMLRFYSGTNRYVALPDIEIPATGLQVNFWTRPESYTNSTCATFQVGYVTNPSDFSTFVMLEEYAYNDWPSNTYLEKTVDMPTIPAGARVAFYHTGTGGWYWFLDDITVTAGPTCYKPTSFTYENVTTDGATLTWTRNTSNADGETYSILDENDQVVAGASNISGTSFQLTGLNENTEYTFKVRTNCANPLESVDVLTVTFTTLANCQAPVLAANGITNVTAHTADIEWTGFASNNSYVVSYRTPEYLDGVSEEFATSSAPTGWSMYTGLLSNIMSGTALTSATYGWSFGSNNGVFNSHARCNIYGNYQRWLVTPEIAVPNNAALNFDLALTAYSGTVASPATTGTDDKFVVLVSTDNMATWSILRQWDNAGSSYVYNNITCSATGENVNIDLSAYAGQNVKVAFYGESTVSNADNNLHIDNVAIGTVIPATAWQTVPTNTTSTTLTGLEAETPYEVKVTGICAGNVESDESAVQTFTTLPSCMAITGLTVSDVTTNSVTLTWTDNANTGATYTIYNVTDNNSIVASGVNATTYTVTGLTENTAYTFGVLPICQEGETTPVTVSTRTECAPKSLPWTCGFEADEIQSTTQATALPWCSYRYASGTTNLNYPYSYSSSTYAHNSTRSLYFYGGTSTSYPETMAFILPQVDVTNFPMNGNRVSFYARSSSASYDKVVHIGTMTDPTDWSTFTEVGTVTVSGTTHTLYKLSLSAATAADAYVALMVERTSGVLYLDDLTLEEQPACVEVTNLAATDVTANSVTLTWTDSDNDDVTYTVYNMDDNTTIATGVAATTYIVTGLTANTPYNFGVMANCLTGNAPTTTTVATRTACATVVAADLPMTWGFEAAEMPGTTNVLAIPWCWTRFNDATGTYTYYPYSNTSNVHSGSRALYFYAPTGAAYATNQVAVLPQLDASLPVNTVQLSFWARGNSTYAGNLEVGTMSDPTDNSTFTLVETVDVSGTTYKEHKVYFVGVTNNDSYIALRMVKGSSTQYAYIDDLTLSEAPSCFPVSNVTASSITANSATISWDANSYNDAGVQYVVYNATTNTTSEPFSGTTYTLEGLTANTAYTVEVKTYCAANDLAEGVSVSFNTLQIPATLPYATGFETTDDNAMWTVLNGTNGWYIGTVAYNDGAQGLYISNDNGVTNSYTSNSSVAYAYRTIEITEAGWYNISYDWTGNGESNYDFLRVALVPVDATLPTTYSSFTTTSLPSGWTALDGGGKLNQSTVWGNKEALLQIETPGLYNVIFVWRDDSSVQNPPAAAVDNVSVSRNAFEPTELTATNITATGATLTWTRDTRNAGYERYTIMNGTETVATDIDANSYAVTLTPNTDYTFTLFATNGNDVSDAENVSLRVNEYPTEAGKMVNLAYSYDFTAEAAEPSVSFYYGMGVTRTAEAAQTLTAATATEATFTNTTSANWFVDGPVTVVFLNHNANVLNFTPAITYLCPAVITDTDPVEETINTGSYTWTTPENHEYTYGPLKGTTLDEQVAALVGTYHDTVLNAGNCDSIYRHLNLTLYPTYEVTLTDEFCQGTTYTVGTGAEAQNYTASVQEDVHLTAAGGADSLVHVDLHMNAAPVALINNNVNNTINSYCEGFDLILTASAVEGASVVTGATYVWEDASTADSRTVNPLSTTTNVYTLIATDPVTGCVSLEPATLTVTTTPVPVLTVTADREAICVGQNSAVLTVTDANNIEGVNFRWYNANTTPATVAGTGATLTVNPTETTNYYVVAEGNCEVQSAPITITVNTLPVVTVAATPAVICQNDDIALTATTVAGYTYEWSTGATTAAATVAAATTGNYTVTVTDLNGCVNEFTTNNVTVNPVYELNDAQSVCYLSNPYTWKAGNQTAMNITEDGNYNYTFQTVNGCDSLVHLTFAFEQMSINNTYREVCQNTDVTWGPTTYTSVQESATLTYELGVGDIDPDNNVLDCPAQYNLILTVNPVKATTFDQVACDSYTWTLNNETYTADATPSVTLATTKGCDSVVTMNLTVNYQNTGVDTQVACDRYEWPLNHNIYTESNTTAQYTLTGANAFGCDSVVTLNLTVNYKQDSTVFYRECGDTVFVWSEGNGLTYKRNVNPEDNITWNLTTADPTVTTVDGCDSILHLHLVMNYVTDTLNWATIEECDSWFIDTVACDGQIARAYYDESNDSIIVRTRNAATGRDQISRIHLTINRSEHQTVPMTACVPYTWEVSQDISHEIVSDTVLSQQLETASGCKLIKVLRFTAKYPTENITPVTLCQDGSWTDGNSVVYDMANYELGVNEPVYWDTLVNNAGCDSVETVVFTVNPVYSVTAEETYCESEFANGPITYVNPNNATETIELTIPGALNQTVYTNTVVADWTTAAGCDSTVTITYTVNPSLTEDVNAQSCYTYTWENGNGQTYTVSGDYTYETTSVAGCDSTVTLHLPIADTVIGIVDIEACGEYTYQGVTYRESMTFYEESGYAKDGCDSITRINYNLTPRVMKDVYIVANAPYTWDNNVEYSTSVENIYYDATQPGGCDSILVLHLTMEQPIVICENELPYTTTFGVTLTEDTTNYTETIEGVLYDIDYTVNHNTVETVTVDNACDSYEWTSGNGETYTVSGNYTFETVNAKGCDSTVTLALTVNVSTDSVLTTVACDTYTWSGETFTESIDTTIVGLVNAKGCDSTATLHLTINVNPGVEETVAICNSYVWNGQTLTASGDYNVSFQDVNGCTADSVLHLTINTPTENNLVIIDTAASTYYNGTYYADINEANGGLPYTFDVLYENGNAKGCDSTDHVTLYVTRGTVIDENYNKCGEFTWTRNNHTYAWIDAAERQANGNALYKDITDANAPVYIHTGENPTAVVADAMGVPTQTYVLWLNMIEANYFDYDLGNIMLSDVASITVNPGDSLDAQTIDLSTYIAAKENATLNVTLHHTSTYYCENVVTYTANLIYNYDTVTPVTICDATTWTDSVEGVHSVTTGINEFDYVTADNWHHHIVVTNKARTNSATQVVTACDTYSWMNGTDTIDTYTTSGVYNWNNNDTAICSLETLDLTVNNSNAATDVHVACDTYTWINGTTYTASNTTDTVMLTNAANCDSVVTLNLTINTNAGTSETVVACDSYTWTYMADPLTASNTYTVDYNDVNGCAGTHTLYLTINNHVDNEVYDTACESYTWVDNNNTEYTASGNYTRDITDANGCAATETLHLVINTPELFTRDQYVYGNGITIDGQFYAAAATGVAHYTVVRDSIDDNGCATTVTVELYVSQYEYVYTNHVGCGSYTWTVADNGDDKVYRTMTATEAAANPTALYWNETDNAPVLEMPRHSDGNMIYVLNLTLNEPSVTEINVTALASQLGTGNVYTTVDGDIDCSTAVAAKATTVITAEFSKGPHAACDSIVRYNINVVYNYDTLAPVTYCENITTYTDMNNVEHNITVGDNLIDFTVNAGADNEMNYHVVVTVTAHTPSAPQVVTACDTYTWEAGDGQIYTVSGTYNWNDDENCTAETLQLTINNHIDADVNVTICDTYTWVDNDNAVYTESGDYTRDITDVNECAATETLHLTINVNAGVEETVVACDSYSWTYAAEPLTESNTYTETFTDGNGCEGTATLHLTINTNAGIEATEANCYTYTWTVPNYSYDAITDAYVADPISNTYTASNTYTVDFRDVNGCEGTATLTLTINGSESVDTAFWFGDGSYRYTGIFTTATAHMYTPGDYAGIVETVNGVTANGCDSIYNITLHVGNNYTHTDAVRSCATYTWNRNNTTYARLTDAQAAEYPTAIYFDQTNNGPVYYNPVVVEPRVNDYADEYMLDLTLDAIHEEDVVVDLPVFPGTLAYGDSIYNVALADHDMGRVFVDSTFTSDVHFGGVQYCDSIVHLTVNVIKNYVDEGVVDLCYTESSYTWEGESIVLDANPDVLNEYYIYHVDAVNNTVKYQKVIQHPIQYTTERRTDCESYTWNGMTFTESTSGATINLTDQYGCDSTVTLVLTINHATSRTLGSEDAPVEACDGYTWTLGDGTVLPDKIEQSGIYTWDYTTAEGCESHDTLYLTVNASTHTEEEVTACDSYTWDAPDGQTYVMVASEEKLVNYTNAAGCASTAKLTLTVNYSTDSTFTVVACDSYTWTLNGETYTESGTYYDTIPNAAGCDSTVTLELTIDKSNGRYEVTACDSYTWTANNVTYTESGAYEYISDVANACGSLTDSLYLTINKNSGHLEEVAICNSNLPAAGYEWNGSYYSTTGEYYYDYTDDNNCSSQDTLKLTIGNVRSYGRVYVENCGPYTWDLTGETFTESTEVSTIMDGANAVGCDSVIMLYLTIYEQPVINETVVICDNELVDYSWRGIAIDAAGEYTDFGGAYSEHCDSVYNLTLTVNERTYSSVDVAYCDSYEWNGETYTESGVYTYTTTNAAGCDNIDTLHLTINVNSSNVETRQACDSYEWNGNVYDATGTYTYEYNDANNCPSVDTLYLTIANTVSNIFSVTACDSYTWSTGNGETYTVSDTYVYNYTTGDNCTGSDTLVLTINNSNTGIDVQTACDTYTWIDGIEYTASNNTATFTLTNAEGCDSVITLNLTINVNSSAEYTETACDSYIWNGAQYIESGDYTYNYTDVNGCASTDILHLTVNASAIDTVEETACDEYKWVDGTEESYTTSGVYTYNYSTTEGCNGTTYLLLTVTNSTNSNESVAACDSYTWNGETYTESGVYTFNTTNAAGCDSTATLNLTINTSNTGVDVQTACDTYTWIDNNVYTASNNTATYTLTNVAGCDSVVTLNLTINNSVATSFADEACNAYVWEGSYYTESGAYTKTFEAANGCDSVVTLTLTINQPVAETITETACGSYTWNGITYNASGNYTQTDVAANGCDSVTTLVLTINQPVTGTFTDAACESYTWNGETYTESGAYTQTFTAANGCDSVVTLTLTINAPANTTEDVTACESYTWHGQVYTTNGAYTYNFTDNNGCAAVATLNLTINTPANTTETVTACNSYSWNNQTYTNSGVYTSTFVDANGCNATATLSLTINNPVNATFTVTECESYTWHGQVYTVSGNYTYTTTAANGCDSIETLVLTINQPTTATFYAEACGSYTWNGTTYTQPGAYPYTTTGSNGCDSTVTLLLNLVQPVQTIINQTACDSYTWNGTTYTTSGSYSVTFTAANNCDSVVTLNLTVNNSVSNSLTATACESYTWNGQTYATSGSYTQVFTAHNGCDSTVTLALTINTPTTATVTETACSSFDWNGETYTTSGSYTYTTTGANGCDSVTTLLLTINLPVYTNLEANAEGSYSWNGETYTESGVYTYTTTAANGCDSVVTLTLTITPVYTVTLVSQNEAWGSVSESGTIAENGYFTATATANEGYEFVAWLNGNDTVSTSSTYIFQVTENITLTAVFAEVQGISAVDMNNVVIYSTDSRIFVNGAEGYDVYVYDVNGRVINRQMKAADAIEFRMTTTGVYLVKVGNAPAKRVVVVR